MAGNSSFVDNISDVLLSVGIAGTADVIGGNGIDHPMRDLAFGAGFSSGLGIPFRSVTTILNGAVFGALSVIPDIAAYASSGDFDLFAKAAGARIITYGVGLLAGTVASAHEGSSYNSVAYVDITYSKQPDAEKAVDAIDSFMKDAYYILDHKSSVKQSEVVDKGFVVSAKIIGKGDVMYDDLAVSLDTYLHSAFSGIVDHPEIRISDIVEIRKKI